MNLARYHARSPRYILQPYDNTLIRVAGPRQDPWEEGTEIRNISLSGLVFTAPSELCPIIGETIKIQFEVPGNQAMACFGLVTRLEPCGEYEMSVGIQFQKLDIAHKIVLLQGLARKLKDQQEKRQQMQKGLRPLNFKQNWKQWMLMICFLLLWILLASTYLLK